jgi:hypothetical protein
MDETYPVATAIGTPFACRCLSKRLTPMINEKQTEERQQIKKSLSLCHTHFSSAYDMTRTKVLA